MNTYVGEMSGMLRCRACDAFVARCVCAQTQASVKFRKAVEALRALSVPQRQDALNNQLRDLQVVANLLGMYDAADLLTKLVRK